MNDDGKIKRTTELNEDFWEEYCENYGIEGKPGWEADSVDTWKKSMEFRRYLGKQRELARHEILEAEYNNRFCKPFSFKQLLLALGLIGICLAYKARYG